MVQKNKITVSIITVVYNGVSFIERTIKSIINQSYSSIEFIIIDGNSTDGTVDIIKSYSKYINFWISEPDKGIYDAMNKGFKYASGDFSIFINADDILYSNETIDYFAKKVTDLSTIYYGDALSLNNKGQTFVYRKGAFSKYRLAKTNICHQTIFYPKSIYKNYTFNTQYKLFADWDLNIRLFRKNNYKYLHIPIALYDINGVSSYSKDLFFEKKQKNLIFKHLGLDCLIYICLRKITKLIIKWN